MAIYHCEIGSISRAKGHSATAAAAYRAGIRIEDERLDLVQDYTKRRGVASVEMLAPADAPAWALNPSRLWNAAEAAETRKNARVAREMEVALPHEMTDVQRQALAREMGQMLVDRYRVAVQVAIHTPDRGGDQRNHHAHILFTSRQIEPNGLAGYAAKVFDDFKGGPQEIRYLREQVAILTNSHLARAGHAVAVDHRTLEEQAISAADRGDLKQARALDRVPTVKEGHAPARRMVARARNVRTREINASRQREWDQMEAQARNEARLMPAHTDKRPGDSNGNRTTAGTTAGTTSRARRTRARRSAPPLTRDSLHLGGLRLDPVGTKPVLSVRAGDRFTVVQSGRGAELGGGALRADESRHRSAGAPLHWPPANPVKPIADSPPQAARAVTGVVAKPVSIPSLPASVARGPAPKARATGGGSAIAGGGGAAAQIIVNEDADEYSRRMLTMMKEQLQEEDGLRRRFIKQLAEQLAISQHDAIRWIEAHRRATEAAEWLDNHKDEPARRFDRRERRKRERDLQWTRYQGWKACNPEPWRFLPKHKQWAKDLEAQAKPMRAAQARYQLAKTAADMPALAAFEKERAVMQRRLERATTERQSIAMRPEEIEEQRNQVVLPTAPSPEPVEQQEDNTSADRSRSRRVRFPVPTPPGARPR